MIPLLGSVSLLVSEFCLIVCRIRNVAGDGCVALSAGRKGRIHVPPVYAVEVDNIVNPALSGYIHAYPCMVGAAGVSDHKLGRNVLGAEHGGHDCRIVEADAGF